MKTVKLLNVLGLDAGTAQVPDDGRFRSPANILKDGKIYVAEPPNWQQDISYYRETAVAVGL